MATNKAVEANCPKCGERSEISEDVLSRRKSDRERWLGVENAKLARRIYHLKLKIREMNGPVNTRITDVTILAQDVQRENRVLRDQNTKLVSENHQLRRLLIDLKPAYRALDPNVG